MITDVDGVRVGHWTDAAARTGCTVVLLPEGTVASGEVRGGAPATRETALLDPTRAVTRVDAVLLTGGSAFGLAAADGVVRFCEERGMGVPTPAGPVPIVVGLGLFDLAVGDPTVRPGPEQGYAACEAASGSGSVSPGSGSPGSASGSASPGLGLSGSGSGSRSGSTGVALGTVGAGTGATVGPVSPGGPRTAGGLVAATVRSGDLVVSALVAVNAFGAPGVADSSDLPAPGRLLGNTTIGVVATNARLDKVGCHLVAQSAHDGLARAVFPAHTLLDGDAFVAAAVGTLPEATVVDVDAVRTLTVHAVARAIRHLA